MRTSASVPRKKRCATKRDLTLHFVWLAEQAGIATDQIGHLLLDRVMAVSLLLAAGHHSCFSRKEGKVDGIRHRLVAGVVGMQMVPRVELRAKPFGVIGVPRGSFEIHHRIECAARA